MRDRVLAIIVPLLLLCVSALQSYNVHYKALTPWKGGGFGMFSTIDEPGRRIVRCYLVGEEQESPVKIPAAAQRLGWEVRSIPTPDRVSHLAREVADDLNASFARSGFLISARHLRVEVWRITFDSPSREVRAQKLIEETVER